MAGRQAKSDFLMAAIFATAIVALPVWQRVSGRWSKRGGYVAGITFWAGVQMVIITVGPSTAFHPLLALYVMAGIGVSAAHVLPWAMIQDAIE